MSAADNVVSVGFGFKFAEVVHDKPEQAVSVQRKSSSVRAGAQIDRLNSPVASIHGSFSRPVCSDQIATVYFGNVPLAGTEGKNANFQGHRLLQTRCGSSNLLLPSSRPDVGYGLSPARGSPLWDDFGVTPEGEGVEHGPDWNLAAQPVADFEVDRRINW